jgi:predicted nucleic acid-binding protein
MRAKVFLDTNIILYAVSTDAAEQWKRDRARELLSGDDVGISVQVLGEFYVNATRKMRLPEDEVRTILESLALYPVLPLTESIFWSALELRKRYQVSYWDGAILAAAMELGCHTLFSEDLSHGQSYGTIRVINPFLG